MYGQMEANDSGGCGFRVGIDVQSVERFQEMGPEIGQRVKERAFSEAERAYCDRTRHSAQRYASRWAAKEAFKKLLSDPSRVPFDSVTVERDTARPWLELDETAQQALQSEFGVCIDRIALDVTLSHDRTADVSIAQVLATIET